MPSDYYVSLSVEKGSVHVWSMDQYFSLSLSKGNPNVKHAQAKSDLQGAISWSIVKAQRSGNMFRGTVIMFTFLPSVNACA